MTLCSVLFVCTGNQYRSPIAAEAFRTKLARAGSASQWKVGSAGTWTSTGRPPLRKAVELARSFGVNIDNHMTRGLDADMLDEFDLVLVMEEGHRESIQAEFPFARHKVRLLSDVVDGINYDVPDPASADGEAREIIADLVTMISSGYEKICRTAETIQGAV